MRPRLTPRAAAALFVIGATGALLGDAGHIASETTAYVKRGVPFVWKSASWFLIAVGTATVATADLRLRIAPPRERQPSDLKVGAGAIAAVLVVYAMTSVFYDQPLGPSMVLIYAMALGIWAAFGDGRPALICGVVAAIGGTGGEIALGALDVARYAEGIGTLAGVAPWLPALYFAFGVVVARLAEIAAVRT